MSIMHIYKYDCIVLSYSTVQHCTVVGDRRIFRFLLPLLCKARQGKVQFPVVLSQPVLACPIIQYHQDYEHPDLQPKCG